MKVSVDDLKKIWKEHMQKFMNIENEWSGSINAKVECEVRRIEVEEVWHAMKRMKIGKASGPLGVALEIFKAGGDKACVHYFLSKFCFQPKDGPSKTMKNAFYFI